MKKKLLFAAASLMLSATILSAQDFKLNSSGYFNCEGVDAMAFSDFYPEGHQGGISILMNGKRVASNGDIRFEPTPGQWQPVPKQLSRKIEGNKIITELCFPDSSRHFTGFNPMMYPDVQLRYKVTLEPAGKGLMVTVDLDAPVPEELVGNACFNLEFFPGELFGKPWIMDSQTGIYPQQPNAPIIEQQSYLDKSVGDFKPAFAQNADMNHLIAEGYSPYTADKIIAEPYCTGKSFTSRPDDPSSKLTVRTLSGEMKMYDGRMNHNNGWFTLSQAIPAGATKAAIQWYIEPTVTPGWLYKPVVQTSQVGYLTNQQKVAVIETDRRDNTVSQACIVKYDAEGEHVVKNLTAALWEGDFLRYRYLKVDFSDVKEPGLYCVKYGESCSPVFKIGSDVFDRGVWQPVMEYFLPVQMCHMRVSEKYRVWHDMCHMDDALMAPEGSHIDGYAEPADNMTKYHAHDIVKGLNQGGWHDAGDFDLRVESQAGECYILSLTYEQFKPEIDVTNIDQNKHLVEIHESDGKNDILQQIENGALTIVNGYLALGRLYRGIICNNVRQYVLLGDAAAMTDGVIGNDDDRWVYTENNPGREMSTAAALAASYRTLKGFNDTLATHCLNIAKEIYDAGADYMAARPGAPASNVRRPNMGKIQTAVELYLATNDSKYFDYIMTNWDTISASAGQCGWYMARVEKQLEGNKKYKKQVAAFKAGLEAYKVQLDKQSSETPYGVPYRPSIWGAGWDIQSFGYRHYFLAKTYPEIFAPDQVVNALNFVLGTHPGTNQSSFASGVGAQSTTVAYGANRADWSYIPGGVASGTALIRPDFPELLVWPYLWQQMEYCLGGDSTHYMFLVLAVKDLIGE